jgi:hypothetical protein
MPLHFRNASAASDHDTAGSTGTVFAVNAISATPVLFNGFWVDFAMEQSLRQNNHTPDKVEDKSFKWLLKSCV